MFAHTKFNMLCTSSLVVQFSKIKPLRSILHSPSGESPCRSVPSLCDSLYIIPHFLLLVKGFSKSFLKFFSKAFRKASETVSFSHRLASGWYFLHPHFQALDYYTTFCSVCQEVFRKFFEVFFVGFRSSTSRYGFASSAFPLASVPWPFPSPSFRALDYYITFRLGCQAFFANFFCFLYDYLFSRKNYPHEGGELVECLQFLSARC